MSLLPAEIVGKSDSGTGRRTPRAVALLCTALMIGLLVGLRGAWQNPRERCVMIHTDDAGMCEAVNAATIDALERGTVTSASIMVPCPGFDEFAQYAASRPEGDFGVHLTLTSELGRFRWGPVLAATEVPSLVAADGKFWRTLEDVAKHARLDEAERELRAQIERARNAKIPISHLDHHMFVLFCRADLLKLYVRLGRAYELPIRFSRALRPEIDIKNVEVVRTYYAAVESLFSRQEPILDLIEMENYEVAPEEKRAFFLSALRAVPPGISEIVIHCAYDKKGTMAPHAAPRRAADARFFQSPEAAEEIRRLGIRLVNWKDIQKMAERQQNSL